MSVRPVLPAKLEVAHLSQVIRRVMVQTSSVALPMIVTTRSGSVGALALEFLKYSLVLSKQLSHLECRQSCLEIAIQVAFDTFDDIASHNSTFSTKISPVSGLPMVQRLFG